MDWFFSGTFTGYFSHHIGNSYSQLTIRPSFFRGVGIRSTSFQGIGLREHLWDVLSMFHPLRWKNLGVEAMKRM